LGALFASGTGALTKVEVIFGHEQFDQDQPVTLTRLSIGEPLSYHGILALTRTFIPVWQALPFMIANEAGRR
jgi:hypothetical protein